MITGQDLIDLGVKRPGKEFGRILAEVNEIFNEERPPNYTLPDYLAIAGYLNPIPELPGMLKEARPIAYAIRSETQEEIDNEVHVRQFMEELAHVPIVSRLAVMPDACPAGHDKATITVGGIAALKNAIMPGAHSADICCSMKATFFRNSGERAYGIVQMMDALQKVTHFGPGGRGRQNSIDSYVQQELIVKTNPFLAGLEKDVIEHMGTQGDGNHFAYIGKVKFSAFQISDLVKHGYSGAGNWIQADKEMFVLVTHHGSRGLGAQVYKRGKAVADKMTRELYKDIPKAATWIPYATPEGRDYWEALQYVSRWTADNHRVIHQRFLDEIGRGALFSIGNEHNFVWRGPEGSNFENWFYHGKGATPAWSLNGRSQLGLIPLNMSEPVLLVAGKTSAGKTFGLDPFMNFAPHGAGRNFSRSKLFRDVEASTGTGRLSPDTIQGMIDQQTKGLDIRWFHGKPDLSESPMAYKNAQSVISQIQEFDLADIIAEIEPLGSMMAGEIDAPWKKKKTPAEETSLDES